MSTFVKHEAPKPSGAKFAWFCAIAWAALIGVMWFLYRDSDGEGGGFLHFIARFHVLIVHLPIGVIFLAFIMEVASFFAAFSHLKRSIPFLLWFSLFSSIAATVVGYLLMGIEDFSGRAMTLHLWFGLAVTVFAFLALLFHIKQKQALYFVSLFIAVFSTAASGHFGGAMVHDADYLTEYAPEPLKPLLLVGLSSGKKEAPVDSGEKSLSERVAYTDFVVPILDTTCNECHNENKIKGDLRMDTHALLLAGADGSDFPTVVPGDAEESEMIFRVLLPEDDEDFMPTKGDPLSPEEVEFLQIWINAGASETMTLAELGDDPKIEQLALAIDEKHSATKEEPKAETPKDKADSTTDPPSEPETVSEENTEA